MENNREVFIHLETCVDHDGRTVEIWLNAREARDPDLKERLRPLFRDFAAQKYLVAVFLSGERDLAQSAGDLLCYNRRRIAQLEVERGGQRCFVY